MNNWRKLFGTQPYIVIGMIHIPALPGTPKHRDRMDRMIEKAYNESKIYSSCNIDGVLIENMHDLPYIQSKDMGPEITACMTRLCSEVRKNLPLKIKCGVQILAGGNKEALAVAKASELQFIRTEGYVFSHIADEGFTDSCAGMLLRYRHQIDADEVAVFTDIKKKHCSHTITEDVTIEETARSAEFFLSDGLIITGNATGQPANAQDLKRVKKCSSLPVIVGSGVTHRNVKDFYIADAAIIGSEFKKFGRWENDLEKDRILRLQDEVWKLREKETFE